MTTSAGDPWPPLRIAHVLPALTKGGAERVAVELMRQAELAGHEVSCIVGWETPPPGVRHLVPAAARLDHVEPAASPLPVRILRAGRWIWHNRARIGALDVLHVHLTYGAIFGSLVWAWRSATGRRTPVVIESYHAVGMGIPPMHQRMHRWLAARRDAVVLMAEDEGWQRFAAGRRGLRLRTILNGASDPGVEQLSEESRRDYRRRIGIPDDCTLVVGTVGMLRADRKPRRWIPVFARIARALGPHVHFVLAGGGPEREHLEALVREHGLDGRVHFTGVVEYVREPLAIMDLYLTVNVGPVTGVAALEAALSGLPILALQFLDAYRAAGDDWIWSTADGDALADRAIALLQDPPARLALAARQQAHARRHHTTAAMAAAYEDVYRAAIAARAPSRAVERGRAR